MALKLQVPWRTQLLQVDYDEVTDDIRDYARTSGSQHVHPNGHDIIVKDFFEENNKVPDVSRYLIGDDKQPVHHRDIPASWLQIPPLLGSIVLLLESPYKDEYQHGNINCPIAPANGRTGENIHRCLGKVLSDIQAELNEAGLIETELIVSGRHVVISNPIQFQTSLHAIHGRSTQDRGDDRWRKLRDKVWRKLWREKYIKQCFRVRLKSYKPSLIINACTSGLKGNVKTFVRRCLPTVPLYKTHHPSYKTWDHCDKYGLRRIYPEGNPNSGDQQ